MLSWPLASTQAGINDAKAWLAGWQSGAIPILHHITQCIMVV